MKEGKYVESLVSEYATLFRERPSKRDESELDEGGIIEELVASADWSAPAARELVRLADEYGAFMLRSALAIAIVLGREDGARGL